MVRSLILTLATAHHTSPPIFNITTVNPQQHSVVSILQIHVLFMACVIVLSERHNQKYRKEFHSVQTPLEFLMLSRVY